jgi:hypothetical protein
LENPTVELFIDASASGWGAWIASPEYRRSNGFFTTDIRGGSSTLREAYALLYALQAFQQWLTGHKVRVFTDNQNVPRVQQKGSSIPSLATIAKQLFTLCQAEQIELVVEWIPREWNRHADELSKLTDTDDWQLNPRLFSALEQLWGPHDVDTFASSRNALLPVFWSRNPAPGGAGTDAFAQDWQGKNLWINPPFGLIGRILVKASQEKAVATLVVPVWKGRPWWPLLQPTTGQWAPFVTDTQTLPTSYDTFRPGQSQGNERGTGSPRWQCIALRIDFRSVQLHSHPQP